MKRTVEMGTTIESVIEVVLLFHSGRPWTEQDQARWEALVGNPEATTKVMCDWLRAEKTESDVYLVWSYEHRGWWGPERCGYEPSISRAGRYSHAEALEICTRAMPGTSTLLGALPELPVRLADVEAMITAYDREFADRPERWR